MSDRRRQRRIPVEHLMDVRLRSEGSETRGRVLDLNNAGAFVATDLALDRDARLEVELCLSGDQSLPLQAVVARRTESVEARGHTIPAGLGIVFLTTNVMERAFIQKAVLEVLKVSLESTRARVSRASEPTSEMREGAQAGADCSLSSLERPQSSR
jgi:hypothetical protein